MSTKRKININTPNIENVSGVIYELWIHREHVIKDDYPDVEKFVLGYPIPDFQRGSVWTQAMEISFIEAIWKRYDIGSWMIAKYDWSSDKKLVKYSDCLIDGQQRLTAIENYWNDKFKVFDYYWSELTAVDKRAFKGTSFPHRVIHTLNEQELRDTYNRLNFAGVRHTEDDRA